MQDQVCYDGRASTGAPARPQLAALAEALRYPGPGTLTALREAAAGLPPGPAAAALTALADQVAALDLGAWEELYARTFDFDPAASPYIGYQVWGEHHRRGELMVELARVLTAAGVDREGELPDHLIPVLRYLATADDPLPALLEALPRALAKIGAALSAGGSPNPYLPVVEAVTAETAALGEGPSAEHDPAGDAPRRGPGGRRRRS